MPPPGDDHWSDGAVYDQYVGRWSRQVAPRFLEWLGSPARSRWVDVGCGTGALTEAILGQCDPASILAVEPSVAQMALAKSRIHDPRVAFAQGGAEGFSAPPASVDVVAAALVLNFVGDPRSAVHAMMRPLADGGCVAGYVWDYAAGMQMIRRFWDAAIEVDPAAVAHDEAVRFPLCNPAALTSLLSGCGLVRAETVPIDITTEFGSFDELWDPFTRGVAPAPRFLASLPEGLRGEIRERYRGKVGAASGGPIHLSARAWAFRGYRPR